MSIVPSRQAEDAAKRPRGWSPSRTMIGRAAHLGGGNSDMRRRDFMLLGGAAAAWPVAARAQRAAHLIGFLISGAPDSFAIFVDAFKQGMLDNGLVEGGDYMLDLRFAEGDYNRFDTLAAEIGRAHV